jgi:outer membrane biosynthesis protein TonB
MRAGTLLLAFTASIILGTADIVHNRHADYLKPEALVEIGIPDATSTMNVTDAVLPRVVESLTNERLEARLIDSRSLERRRGRAGRGGRGGRTRRPARKTRPKKKTQKKKTKAPKKKAGPQKKKTGTRNRTGAQKNKTGTQKKKTGTQKKKTGTQKKKTGTQKKKNQAAKSCPAKTKPKGKVGARELEHSLVGRAPGGKGPASNTRWQCENKCRAKIRTVGEDPCAALKGQKSFVPCAKPSEFNIPVSQISLPCSHNSVDFPIVLRQCSKKGQKSGSPQQMSVLH